MDAISELSPMSLFLSMNYHQYCNVANLIARELSPDLHEGELSPVIMWSHQGELSPVILQFHQGELSPVIVRF